MEERVRTVATTLLGAGLLLMGSVALASVSQADTQAALDYYKAISLLGGGLMVLTGLVLRSTHPAVGTAMLVVGAVTGLAASMGTVVLPVLILVVVGLTLRDQTRVGV